ncbi:hypothetical protein D3C78_1427440 [compost metagenome]
MEHQQRQHGQHGEHEDLQDLLHVGVGPADQHRLAGGVQSHIVAGFRLAQGLQLGEGLLVVELALDQLRLDQRHLEVRRYQRAVNPWVGHHVGLHRR